MFYKIVTNKYLIYNRFPKETHFPLLVKQFKYNAKIAGRIDIFEWCSSLNTPK